jgi:hypothetical protein
MAWGIRVLCMMNNKKLSFFRIGTMWNLTSDNLTRNTRSFIVLIELDLAPKSRFH